MNGEWTVRTKICPQGVRAMRVTLACAMALLLGVVAHAQMQPAQPIPDLKQAPAAVRVVGVTHCGSGAIFHLKMQDGQTRPYAEINLRIKLDSTGNGPPAGMAILLPAGMTGDRASLVFHSLADVTALVREAC